MYFVNLEIFGSSSLCILELDQMEKALDECLANKQNITGVLSTDVNGLLISGNIITTLFWYFFFIFPNNEHFLDKKEMLN